MFGSLDSILRVLNKILARLDRYMEKERLVIARIKDERLKLEQEESEKTQLVERALRVRDRVQAIVD